MLPDRLQRIRRGRVLRLPGRRSASGWRRRRRKRRRRPKRSGKELPKRLRRRDSGLRRRCVTIVFFDELGLWKTQRRCRLCI
jgi:hypothetical protein